MPRTVLVGEAWGRREAAMQHPLVGPSGRELTLELGISGFAPFMQVMCRTCKQPVDYTDAHCPQCTTLVWPNELDLMAHWTRLRRDYDIHVTNVFNTQPPNNDLGNFFGTEPETEMPSWKASQKSGGSHLKSEHMHHIKRLWTEIRDLKPNLVVAMGNAACWATIFQTKITTLRGTVTWSDHLDVKVLPTFHPAAVLRAMPMRASVLADFQKAVRERQYADIKRPKRFFTIPDATPSGVAEGYDWFNRPATAYAIDIETIRDQISIVGFARSASDALVVPIRNADFTNYWPSSELEIAAWKLIIHGTGTKQPKIFQNGLFDISHLVRMGIVPNNCQFDTMLWHHAEYPELPKSLGFLGSVYADEVAWKILRTQGTLKRDE